MDIKEKEEWIRSTIPQLEYQRWKLISCDLEGVVCKAPLKPNKNIHNTAFAGSISSLMIICGWLQVNAWTEKNMPKAKIVLKNFKLDYQRPVQADMTINSTPPDQVKWEELKRSLQTRGRGTIEVLVEIKEMGKILDKFLGLYYLSL